MGDGSLMLLPTPGHTAGSASLLSAAPPGAAAAGRDLTYGTEILQRGQLPGVGNRRLLAESTARSLRCGSSSPPGRAARPRPHRRRRLLDS